MQSVNSKPAKLQPCAVETLRLLFKDITQDARHAPINLGIGAPEHPITVLSRLVRL